MSNGGMDFFMREEAKKKQQAHFAQTRENILANPMFSDEQKAKLLEQLAVMPTDPFSMEMSDGFTNLYNQLTSKDANNNFNTRKTLLERPGLRRQTLLTGGARTEAVDAGGNTKIEPKFTTLPVGGAVPNPLLLKGGR